MNGDLIIQMYCNGDLSEYQALNEMDKALKQHKATHTQAAELEARVKFQRKLKR